MISLPQKIFVIILFFAFTLSSKCQKVPAFPGAEGFGKYSKGGRGGVVFFVSNLNDRGKGSLREAIEAEGPRIVIFEISGTIDLETSLVIENPYISILGQTAPFGGVSIRGNMFFIQTHDVIIRFLRLRPGDVNFGEENDWASLDCIDIGKSDQFVYNIIIDHCSLSWGIDENIGMGVNVFNVTIQNSIVSENLHLNFRRPSNRSKGILVGFKTERISIINNFFAHNYKRHPRLSNGGLADVRNNIIYNPAYMGINLWNRQGKPQEVNIVGNIFMPGPNTNFNKEISFWDPPIYIGKAFIENNIGLNGDKNRDNWDMVEDAKSPRLPLTQEQKDNIRVFEEFANEVTYTKSFEEMFVFAEKYIGASLPFRDPVDSRVINDWQNGTGKIINSQNEVGGWPNLSNGLQRMYSFEFVDEEDKLNGLPNKWMEFYNILPGQENDDLNSNGYTVIEEYLNGTNPRSTEPPSWRDVFKYWGGAAITGNLSESMTFNQNFPNPFTYTTTIRFSVKNKGRVTISIYDLKGRIVTTLVNTELSNDEYEVIWKPDSYLKGGIYLAHISYNDNHDSILMLYKKE